MRKHVSILAIGFLLLAGPSLAAEKIVLKLGHVVPATHPYHLGAQKFADEITKRTGGRVEIQIFPAGQLATGERALLEGLQLGTIDMSVTSTGPMPGFDPKISVLELPFLFKDNAHVYRVLDGKIGQELLASLEKKAGIKGLAFFENGWRNITNSKRPIKRPEDLQGIKIRTMENKVHLASFEAWGALPTPMSWGEVYTALQQKTIDAQENPIPIIYTTKIYEVQKYVSLTRHFYSAAVIAISPKAFNRIPADIQRAFQEAAKVAAAYEREKIAEQERQQVALLKEKGMVVEESPDREAFRKMASAVYKKFEPELGRDIIERIQREAR